MKFEDVKSGIPKPIKVVDITKDRAHFTLSQQINGLLLSAAIFPILLMWPIGYYLFGGANFALQGYLGAILLSGGTGFLIYRASGIGKKADIIVTSEAISINDKNYRRELWGGFAAGDVQTITQTSKNGPSASQSFGRIDFWYGGVKEKTKFSVDGSHHADVINWMNDTISLVGLPENPTPSNETGSRSQAF